MPFVEWLMPEILFHINYLHLNGHSYFAFNLPVMLHNFLRTAMRHLFRNARISTINIIGLSLGMTCALLAVLFVQDEWAFDRFHENGSRIYRINTTVNNANDGSSQVLGTTGQIQGPAFAKAIPEIEGFVRILGTKGLNLVANGKSISARNLYVDSNFFGVFTFPLLSGNARTALAGLNTIVLSQATAIKFFGSTDIIGKSVKMEEGRGIENLVITGIARDAPANSSIQFDVLIPFAHLQTMFTDNDWSSSYLSSFLLLRPGADPIQTERKMAALYASNEGPQTQNKKHRQYSIVPLTSIHLDPKGLTRNATAAEEGGLSAASSLSYSYILLGIVGFIILMACINFINLNIASSLRRSKEIGIRKLIGSSRGDIIIRFILEAAIICFASVLLSMLLSKLLLPVFNELAGKKIQLDLIGNPLYLMSAFALMIICIGISGLYPAILLSHFDPVKALAGKQTIARRLLMGKALIVLQFSLAVGLLFASFVYYRQMKFVSDTQLGFNPQSILKVHLPPQRIDAISIQRFSNELRKENSIQDISSEMGPGISSLVANGRTLQVRTNSIDEQYLSTLQIPLIAGRNFYGNSIADSAHSAIVNQTFARAAGWDDPIGKQFIDADNHVKTIVGLVKDYHYASLKDLIEPEVLSLGNRENLLIKMKNGNSVQAISATARVFNNIFPDHYFEYQFLDDEIANSYITEKRWQQIILLATASALIICCIGLFGLSIFAAQQRIKEIGIRKLLGASVLSIVRLLSTDYLILVLTSILIASIPEWLIMHSWLEQFAYRIRLDWQLWAIPAFAAIGVAMGTIAVHSVKAARANPAQIIKTQ